MTQQQTVKTQQPNRFTLSDFNARIIFFPQAPSPLETGDPVRGSQLDYRGTEGTFSFRSRDITQQKTPLGLLITATLIPNVDAGGLDLALVLPTVNLGNQKQQDFQTIAIKIKSRGKVVNPVGADLIYEVLTLKGSAEVVPNL